MPKTRSAIFRATLYLWMSQEGSACVHGKEDVSSLADHPGIQIQGAVVMKKILIIRAVSEKVKEA